MADSIQQAQGKHAGRQATDDKKETVCKRACYGHAKPYVLYPSFAD
jgi:hypothetical protein